MAQPFSFPPPPPPPPPKSESSNNVNTQNQSAGYGNFRGRASFRGGQPSFRRTDSRGRGHGPGGRAGYSHHNFKPNGVASSSTQTQEQNMFHNQSMQSQMNPSQKRTHEKAFNAGHKSASQRSRPLAPPAVPSFGLDLDLILPKKPNVPGPLQNQAQKKGNLLGLTPAAPGDESESDDEGEETRLAGQGIISGLQFEYKGQTSSLQTAAELAAWLAERRKRWPTQERVDVARKEAEEKRKKWEAEKRARLEASREAIRIRQEQHAKDRVEREKAKLKTQLLARHISNVGTVSKTDNEIEKPSSGQVKASSKAERLRLKALRTAEKLRALEESLQEAEAEANEANKDEQHLEQLLIKVEETAYGEKEPSLSDNDSIDDTSEEADDAEETSSSGTSASESDTDSAPEVISSKLPGPERVLAPPRNKTTSQPQTLCHNFAKLGRCKRGNNCRYLHERPDKNSKAGRGPHRRKSLYQVMVEKEQEEERKQALRVIISLGERGLLDDNAADSKQDNT